MNGFVATLLSLAVVASLLLLGAGGRLILRREDPRRGWLMLAAGLVTLLNVWLYATLPPQL